MKNLKENEVRVAGRIASVDVRPSTKKPNEHFGTMSIAVDDGYFDKAVQGQQRKWVERVYFITAKIDNRIINQLKCNIQLGDQVAISGTLVVDEWVNLDKSKGSKVCIRVSEVRGHITKAEVECLKANGLLGQNSQQPAPVPAYNHNQNGFDNPRSGSH